MKSNNETAEKKSPLEHKNRTVQIAIAWLLPCLRRRVLQNPISSLQKRPGTSLLAKSNIQTTLINSLTWERSVPGCAIHPVITWWFKIQDIFGAAGRFAF